jgi:hypothetical protein
MAYSSRYLLERIIEIQNIVIREKRRGASQKCIYNKYIRDTYHISISTYNNYMCRNARRELASINKTSNHQLKTKE